MLLLRGDEHPFALAGEWAGAHAVLGSAPVRVADPEADPFSVLDQQPLLEGGESGAAGGGSDAAGGGSDLRAPRIGGGWFGWLGYPLGALVESLPPPPPARASVTPWWLAYYDHVVVHDGERWWFEALWTPERDAFLREREELWRVRLASPAPSPRQVSLGPFEPVGPGGAGHRLAVEECVRRIAEGELFQANVCLRLEAPWAGDGLDLFARALPAASPRFGALFGDAVISLSPERFLRRTGRRVETDPIKGTSHDPGALRASAKDAAEHVMIVDLMRNDLGRVCEYGSIVAHEPRIEPHANVFHLVSTVAGNLRPDATDADVLRATFPPGSVTGAPKVQAMKTIARLEATARGVYTGAIGYASPIAGLELSVAIRTFEARDGRIWLGAGGGIVADSDPQAELAEALTKAAGPIAAIGGATTADPPQAARERVAGGAAGASGGVFAAALPRALDLAPRPDPSAGVFETALALDGVVQHADEHLTRLSHSVAALYDAALPPEAGELLAGAAATIPRGRARVRLEARPAARPGVIALHATATPVTGEAAPPQALVPFLLHGGIGPHKWLDRRLLDALAATVPPGAYPVLVDGDGLVLETHRANIWIVEDGRRLTPPADGRILPGVTRAHLLATDPTAREEPIPLELLEAAGEVFLTSAIALIRPLAPVSI